jgi:hypothetical protein
MYTVLKPMWLAGLHLVLWLTISNGSVTRAQEAAGFVFTQCCQQAVAMLSALRACKPSMHMHALQDSTRALPWPPCDCALSMCLLLLLLLLLPAYHLLRCRCPSATVVHADERFSKCLPVSSTCEVPAVQGVTAGCSSKDCLCRIKCGDSLRPVLAVWQAQAGSRCLQRAGCDMFVTWWPCALATVHFRAHIAAGDVYYKKSMEVNAMRGCCCLFH